MNNINYSLSRRLGLILQEQKLKLAVAESCTGGGLAEQITAVGGSSAWFDCGFVVYNNQAKVDLLGVSPKTLEKFGAVSEQVAREMAKGAIVHSHADLAISITGIAGPGGGSVEKPVGMVCFGLAERDGDCESRVAYFTSGRKFIRRSAICFSLQWLLNVVQKISMKA